MDLTHLSTDKPRADQIDGMELLVWETIEQNPGITIGRLVKRACVKKLLRAARDSNDLFVRLYSEINILRRLRHLGVIDVRTTGYGFHKTMRCYPTNVRRA